MTTLENTESCNWFCAWLRKKLGMYELNERVRDVERHFVTKRDGEGKPVQTLADVPLGQRKDPIKPRGMSIQQRKEYLERTDGGRIA